MSGLYNNNSNPIPGNGADVFGDKLVGNQFVDGTSQFTLGNFSITSNFTQKNSRDFSLGNFSEPINLETLQITDISESKLLASNKLEVFIKFDRSKVSNYTLYGSLRERLKVAVQQVIRKFPASMKFDQFRTWADFLSGETATNITFNPNTNETNLNLNLYTLFNPFGLEFTQASLIPTGDEFNELRNLLFSFKKYSLYLNNVQYPLTFIQATSGNTNLGSLNIKVTGNPFSGQSSTVDTFHIKPNTLTIEESFDSLEDIEKFLVERKSNPIYTAKFQQPQEGANGVIVKGKTFITWPSTEDGNIIISGSLFDAYLSQLFDVADTFDSYKTNLVSRFLTTAAFKEFDTYDEKVDKILKIYGRSFDDVKKYIDGLAYMTNVTYDSQNNVPNELLKNLAQTLGWGTPSAIKNEGFLDTLFKRNENPEYPSQGVSPTPSELDFELYRRLLVNTAYLFKSKGTRRGIEFMLRFVGAPEALIEFNEHVYVAGQPMNMQKFKEFELKISGGTYTEEQPVLQTYFSAATNSFPPIIVTGFSQGYETITKNTTVNPSALPVDKDGYPTIPKYGPNAYFQAGAGWFEETTEHTGKEVVDFNTSVFTGNTPFIKTKLNKFTYGEPYLQLYRKFPDSKLGFPIVRTVDNKKSWVKKDSNDFRYLNLADRGTNYQTKNDKLVINVKNVDVFLNVGQGLEWDVWNHSRRYSCPFGPNALSSPYPGVGGPDWTEILADATKLSFFEFAQKFWTVLINVKNRQTIDDGHAGGYPTLLSIYLDYMNSDQTCGIPSNKYTYEKMIEYVENMGDYWIRLLEQLIPATTIWQGGVKYENSIFHRYKYSYKHEPLCEDLDCFGSFVNCCYPITNDVLVNAFLDCGGLEFSGATWQNKITLGGTVYTGNTYYSSTTLYDIPSTNVWLDDMVGILSGITQDVTDPNHNLTYYLINDNNTPTGIQIDQPNCVVIQGPCGTGQEVCDCPPGYEYDTVSELCVAYTASTTTSGQTINKAGGNNNYSSLGARFCIPGSYTTCGTGAPASNFNVIGGVSNPFWDANGTTTGGRLNQVGVNSASMIGSTDFFGFSRCIEVAEEGEYLFALAGDDEIRATLNGVQIVNNPWNGGLSSNNFRYWWVWPVTLNAGQNTLLLEGANGFATGPTSFGCEIIGPFSAGTFTVNTDFDIFSTQAGIDTYTANTIFSSINEVGNTFNTETNTCPSGYTYDVCTDSCIKTTEPGCTTYPDGEDAWNFNNGSDPHTFKTEICLNIETNQVSPTPDKDIWVFYLYKEIGLAQTNAAKVAVDNWVSSLGTSYTGHVYHLPVINNRWLSWASLPKSGGTITIGTGLYFNNFTLPPGSGGSNYTIDPNVSDDVLMIGIIPDSRKSYHSDQDFNSCGFRTPQNDISDWSYITTQPTSEYQTDFTEFSNVFNNYNSFQAFIYPVITGKPVPQTTFTFPLHIYGALSTSTVLPADLVENPTVTALGGTLSAITFSNPYTALTATNLSTGYSGPGLENFGFGASYDAGTNMCGGLTCSDLAFSNTCTSQPPFGTFDPTYFYTNGIFQSQLAQFLGSSATTTSNICEICVPICYNDEFIDVNLYDSSISYNYNDKVLDAQGNVYVWKGNDNSFTGLPSVDSEWILLGPIDAIPFLGGNNFTEGEDCDNFDEVIEPPEVTGTTITTNPEIFKDGIFNVGGQDCFVSTYNPCEELVDPCACDATYGEFDVSSTLFELGDVVCCPGIPSEGITERKWVRTDNFGVCRDVALFIPSLCGEEPSIPKCWSLCDDETSGENRTSGGKSSKEHFSRPNRVPSLIVNDIVDPCDPEEPTEPTNSCLDCGDGNVKSMMLNLDFYDIPPNQVPQKVLDFAQNEDHLGEISGPGTISSNKNPFKKARINLCCLTDKLIHYFRVYNRIGPVPTNPQEISYGHVEVNYDIDQNTIVEFYYQPGRFGLGGDRDMIDKLFMYIPPSTNQIQSTPPTIVDNPSVGNSLSTQNITFSSFFNSLNEICVQIGRRNSQQQLSFFKLRRYPDSSYLTDNGTGTNNAENNDIFDRYWALDPKSLDGQGLYGAMSTREIIYVVGSTEGPIDLLRSNAYRYNWEMKMSCKGSEYQDIIFNPSMIENSQLYTNGDVPFSLGCGTDTRTPLVNQNESSNRVPVRIADLTTKGNTFNIPVEKAMEEAGVNKDILKNYEVRNSEMYIISNTNPLTQSRNIEYNSPVTITNTNGPTSEIFVENNRKRIKLGWLDKVAKGSENNLIIEFVSNENKSRFSQDIKQKSVGNGVLTLPNEEELPSSRNTRGEDNVSFYNSTDNRSLDIRVNDPNEPTPRKYVTYTDLRDWAINSIGEIKDLSNKQILYTSGGLVQGFQIGPTYTTNVANSQYLSGLVPIGDVETEFLISTLGSFEDYVRNQTGSTSSGLTISLSGINTNYSGYTNLSGYTDNQEQNISPDFVFDISLKGSSMSLGSNIAMSDPIMGEFRLIGDDRQLHPSIPLPLVEREPVLFNLTRQEVSEGGEYFYYKIPKTQNYRLQYKSHLKLEYFDEGWCEYLNVYRNLTENTFPNNDYEFKQLINSSILYNGGFASAPAEYQEGNIANNYTQPYGYLTPVFGYSPNQGFGNFNTTVYIQRIISGTTSATTLGKYTVASNSTITPSANETLILPYNDSDKFTDLYQCTGTTGTTAIFTKECDFYIDTGCVTLDKGDEIRLKVEINWDSTTKAFTGSTTGTSVNLTLGSNYTTNPESRPWFRVINKECNVTTSNNYLYWQPNEDSVLTESFINGKNVPPSPNDKKGKLILLNSIEEETNYLVPKVNKNNLNNLTYLDIPTDKNYKGPLKLIPTTEKTNNWVKAIEEGRITDYRINDVKLLNIDKGSEVKWNIPVNFNNEVESISLDDSSHTFVVQSTVGVKGTDKSFDIINTLEPNVTTESIKEPNNESKTLLDRGTISYISSRPLEDRTIDFRENHTIIRDKVIIVESGVYDKDTPTPTPSRGEYCKCGKNTYLEVPKTSNYPCSKWCCATDYNGTEYYGCKGKTPAQWIDGLYRDTNISTRPLIITEGKPPGVIRF